MELKQKYIVKEFATIWDFIIRDFQQSPPNRKTYKWSLLLSFEGEKEKLNLL